MHRQRHGDRSAARTDVSDAQRARGHTLAPGEHLFDQEFGLRAWHQDARPDGQAHVIEGSLTGKPGEGHAIDAPVNQAAERAEGFRGQRLLRAREERPPAH